MEKIAIFTLQGIKNYGNRLQNLAVEKICKKMGWSPCSILLSNHPRLKPIIQKNRLYLKIVMKGTDSSEAKRQLKFIKFNETYLNVMYIKPEHLKNIDAHFDIVACGGDQVWNPEFNRNFMFFLLFSNRKKICFSPSFGVSTIPEDIQVNYKKGLLSFKSISVREKMGAKIINDLAEKKAEVLIDPVMAIDKGEWIQLEKKPSFKVAEEYIFTYSLGNRHLGDADWAKNIAQLTVCDNFINIYDDKGRNTYIVDPLEFVWLIHHAKYVFTDSFHAIAFSIIFETPFVACERVDHMESMNSRIEDLLDIFGLSQFTELNVQKTLEMPEMPATQYILQKERDRFYDFLRKSYDNQV